MSQSEALIHETYICNLEDILIGTGVCALVGEEEVAVFKTSAGVFAVSNMDPFTQAQVISRGLIGETEGRYYVASPLHKQRFDLQTGVCFEDDLVALKVFEVQLDEQKKSIFITA